MEKEKKGLNISAKSFIIAIAVLLALMIATYVLTLVVPGGRFSSTTDSNGNEVIDFDNGFTYEEGGIPFWKWLLSPILVLGAEGSGTIIAVIAFLLVIGGIFNSLDKSGLMKYMLSRIISKFGKRRYVLMAVVTLFFMGMGAFVGSFEECVPMVPIVVALAVGLGWDIETGLGMSLIAVGSGFASGVFNPFTVGVAQQLVGLPVMSGIWFRLLSAVLIYILLLICIYLHAKKVEKPVEIPENVENKGDKRKNAGLISFAAILLAGILLVLLSPAVTALRDYTMVIVVVMFLAAGITSTLVSGFGVKNLLKTFLNGLVSILPAVLMILMASSIRYTLEEASVMDTILYNAGRLSMGMPAWAAILLIYAIALVVNFFVSSGSAEAILLMPLLKPLADIHGISAQLCVLAYAYGDGFSNVFYPTNAVLLISLGLVGLGYGKYVKFSWKFQVLNLILTSGLLLLGLAVGYN